MRKLNLLIFKQLLIFVVLVFMGNSLFAYSIALQERFKWRNDDGSETLATWKTANINVPINNVANNENIRIRFVLDETEPGSFYSSYAFQMHWSTSPAGTYTAFSDAAGSPFKISTTDNYTNGELTTGQIGTGYGLTWESLGVCVDETGEIGLVLTDEHYIEMEYCLQPTGDAIAGQTYFFTTQYVNNSYFSPNTSSIFASFTMATSDGAPAAHDNTPPEGTGTQEVIGTNTGATVNFSNVTIAGPMNFDRWDVTPPTPPTNGRAKYWSVSQGTTQFSGTFNLTLPTTGIVGYTPEQLFIFHRANEKSSWTKLSNVSVVNGSSLQVTGLGTFGQFTIAPEPETPMVQATNVLFANVGSTQMDISWTRGNGPHCAAFILLGNSGTALPVNSTAYTANTVFALGDQIGSTGWYCIYDGSEANPTVTVTGLTLLTEYRVQVCEYSVYYNTDVATGNPANKTTIPLSGTGTSGNPYQISTLDNLAWLSANSDYWSFHFAQTTNIDATATSDWNSGEGFSPIGTSTDYAFAGTYDGQNHTIDGLFINRLSINQAMFGYIIGATIKDIGLTDVSINTNSHSGALVGGMNASTISNCNSSGTVSSTSYYVGGLIGYTEVSACTISDCYSSCTVNGNGGTGGLIGEYGNGTSISNSHSSGDVTSTGMNTGGLAGRAITNTYTTNCYSTSDVVSSGTTVGGLVGHMWDSETINNSYATGNVTGTDELGGLVGHMGGGSINNCYSRGDVTDTDGASGNVDLGAFTGYVMGGQINNSYATGSVYYLVGAHPSDKGFVADYYVGHVIFSDNFFDVGVSNQTTGVGATAKTTEQMKTQSTFTDAGWDFVNIWAIDGTTNDGYPFFGDLQTTWTGTTGTAWETNTNWSNDILPTVSYNVIIADVTNDPVIATGVGASCNNLTVNSGGDLTVQSGGSLITNGTIINNGSIDIEKTISDGQWHFVSAPIAGATAAVFTGEYLQYWTETSGLWDDVPSASFPLVPTVGYSLWGVAKGDYTFSGTPNTGNQSLDFTAEKDYGWNLAGNPYPSALDWELVIAGQTGLNNAVYCYDGDAGNYVSYIDGVGDCRYIPAMQGFFVSATTAGKLYLNNTHRVHNAAAFYKNKDQLSNYLSLSVNGNDLSDKFHLRINGSASENFDGQYDAFKLMSDRADAPQVYSFAGSELLTIDQRPDCEILQLGFKCETAGIYTFVANEINDISNLLLEDTKTNTFHKLQNGAYEFVWDVSDDETRFKLHFKAVGIEESAISEINILIYAADGQIIIKNETGVVETHGRASVLTVMDMIGRTVLQQTINASELTAIPVNLKTGVYIVSVKSGNEIKTEKIFIK